MGAPGGAPGSMIQAEDNHDGVHGAVGDSAEPYNGIYKPELFDVLHIHTCV